MQAARFRLAAGLGAPSRHLTDPPQRQAGELMPDYIFLIHGDSVATVLDGAAKNSVRSQVPIRIQLRSKRKSARGQSRDVDICERINCQRMTLNISARAEECVPGQVSI